MGLEELLLIDMNYALNIIKILANENRLLILCYLNNKERSVNELSLLLKMPQPSVSQHLALMRNSGLVETKHQKQHVFYSLANQEVKDIINIIYKHHNPKINN
jgi:DNA-binding transcriptional ArsR family regulator